MYESDRRLRRSISGMLLCLAPLSVAAACGGASATSAEAKPSRSASPTPGPIKGHRHEDAPVRNQDSGLSCSGDQRVGDTIIVYPTETKDALPRSVSPTENRVSMITVHEIGSAALPAEVANGNRANFELPRFVAELAVEIEIDGHTVRCPSIVNHNQQF